MILASVSKINTRFLFRDSGLSGSESGKEVSVSGFGARTQHTSLQLGISSRLMWPLPDGHAPSAGLLQMHGPHRDPLSNLF